MHPNGVLRTGISAPHPKSDLSDLPAILDRVGALGVENIELNPRYWYAVEDCVAAPRAMAGKARTDGLRKTA